MDHPTLTSLSLTHVHYNPHDIFSWISAYLALVPQALIISYVTLIWATREIEVVIMFAGQLGCEGLNWILKRYFREARPTETIGKGYGMPSSHAQYAFYFATYLSLFLLFRQTPSPNSHPILLTLLTLLSASAVAYSRIYLTYHTSSQVLVGCAAGAGCALAWFCATAMARRMGVVEGVLEGEVMRWLKMRDLVVEESLEEAGWERWENRRRWENSRRGKMGKRKEEIVGGGGGVGGGNGSGGGKEKKKRR
ncbi:putative dolichyldiphosphatase [Sphaerulina musiva]